MKMASPKYFGFLTNDPIVGYVNVPVQALFHCHDFRYAIKADADHRRNNCLRDKCLVCEVHNVFDSIEKEGVGDSSGLAAKWSVLSNKLSADKQVSAFEVFHMFLTKMRMDFFFRLCPETQTLESLHSTVISEVFGGELKGKGQCPICGEYQWHSNYLFLEIAEFVESSLQQSILLHFEKPRTELCRYCRMSDALVTPSTVFLPKNLIVHMPRSTLNVAIAPKLLIHEVTFEFQSCFVQKSAAFGIQSYIFFGRGSDGIIRKFENGKINQIKIATLLASNVHHDAQTTVIYTADLPKKLKVTSSSNHPNQKLSRGVKVMSYPNVDSGVDLFEGLPSKRHVGTQTEIVTYADFSCQAEVLQPMVSYEKCKKMEQFKYFVGLNVQDFEALFHLIGGQEVIRHLKLNYNLDTPKKIKESKMSAKDRLLMFCVRLRRGLPLEELALIFSISVSYAGEICYAMTRLIYLTFKSMEDRIFVSAEAQKKWGLHVMAPFPNLRVILDGASFFIQRPSNFEQQGNTHSSYKGTNVVLFVIGISCSGNTIFCSLGMEGSMSDKQAVLKSGLLERLSEGDSVMTDRGFDLTAELQAVGCKLFKPPSKGNRQSLTAEEEMLTKAIAEARIYVEHAIGEIKQNRLLQGVIPLTLLPVLSDLVYVAAMLRNFNQGRVINKEVVHKAGEPQ